MSETDKSRAAFEAWARGGNMSTGTLRHIGYAEGSYSDSRTHAAWLGWQASRRAALEEAAKVCEGLAADHDEDAALESDERYAVYAKHQRRCAAAIRELAGKTKEGLEP